MAVIEPSAAVKGTPPLPPKVQKGESYWQLVWWKFKKNKLAIVGGIILIIFYSVCGLFAEFFAPYLLEHTSDYLEAPPQIPHFIDQDGKFHLRPFVYGHEKKIDPIARKRIFVIDTLKRYPLYFLVRGDSYKLLGLLPMNIHLIGTHPDDPEAHVFLLGTDRLGRDLFSRIFFGGRISLFVGLMGQFISLTLGSILGAASGYYGGFIDLLVQRIIEFMTAFPTIPLWMALAAAIPPQWSPIMVWFGLTLILSLIGWGGLARQVRGMVLSLREREFVLAAKSFGTSERGIMIRHLIPNAFSHIIVIATLSVPGMIIGETALSFLGLGLRPPVTSWGVLLREAQYVRAIRYAPWSLIPAIFVVLAVLSFNFLGDGLRDAVDPYAK